MPRRFLLICVLGLVSACRHDGEAHFAAGMAVSQFVTHQTGSQLKGCAAALGAGLLKEAIDSQGYGVVDERDVFSTVAGCQFNWRF